QRLAALCDSAKGPCESTFLSARSTNAAPSRVYSGGRSDRTVYSSPPIITLTACFFVLTAPPLQKRPHQQLRTLCPLRRLPRPLARRLRPSPALAPPGPSAVSARPDPAPSP